MASTDGVRTPTPASESTTANTARLSKSAKLAYGVGDFGFAFTDTTLNVLFAIFLTDVVGLKPSNVALALWIGKSWDYINDPIVGYLADRTRTRWGRRRPYLLFGFVPFGAAFSMVWWRPPFESQIALTAYYAAAFLLYDTMVTLVSMPFLALTPELTQDYDERTSLTAYRMAFSLLGGLAAFTVPLAIVGTMRPEHADQVFRMGWIFGIISSAPLLLTFWGSRERQDYSQQAQPRLKESLRALRNNRPLLFAAGIFLFTWTAIDIIEVMLLYFLKYRMGLEPQADIITGTVFITALAVLPFWVWSAGATDKRRSYVYGMVFLSAVMTVLAFIDPSVGLLVVLALAALAGIGLSAVHVLTWAMIPDAVEVDELESGARHEGMFYALVTLINKITISIAMPLALLVMDWSGFSSNAPTQSARTLWAIRILTGPVPALFLLAGILFALFYPVSRESHAATRERIAARVHRAEEGTFRLPTDPE